MLEHTEVTCVVADVLIPEASSQPGNLGLWWELETIISFSSITLAFVSVQKKLG